MKLLYTKYNSLENKKNFSNKKLNIENIKFCDRIKWNIHDTNWNNNYTNLCKLSTKEDYTKNLFKIA